MEVLKAAFHRVVEVQLAGDGSFGLDISGEADQRVTGADIEVNIRQWLYAFEPFDLRDQLEEEAQLADFGSLFHDIDAIQVVDDDGFENEIAAIGVPCRLCQDITEMRNVAAGAL